MTTTTDDIDGNDGAEEASEETDVKAGGDVSIDSFYTEYSKSNRSKCRKCDSKIEKV